MEAVILAAGYGSRLGYHTRDIPKALLRVGGRPILSYTLEALMSNGITNFVIVTGHKGHKIREFVRDYDANFSFVHNHLYRYTNNIYSLYLAMQAVRGGFYIINSDVLFHPLIFHYIDSARSEHLTLSVDLVKRLGEEEMKVTIRRGYITKISKKIPPSAADGEYIGITKVPKNVFDNLYDHIEIVMEEMGKTVFYEEAFQSMINDGHKIAYESTHGLPWIEIDTPDDLMLARDEIYPMITSL
jgi:choline kinase